MYKQFTSYLLLGLSLGLVYSELSYPPTLPAKSVALQRNAIFSDISPETSHNRDDTELYNYDKRLERYAFGLGRRGYTYTNGGVGMKRLPVYNFGLGKRARPYSFGLGKRGEYDDEHYDTDMDLDDNNMAFADDKRDRPYSFGLGKRQDGMHRVLRVNEGNRYGFGLGR